MDAAKSDADEDSRVRAYRTELDPTVEQRHALARQAGAARWVYNWTLAEWRSQQAERLVHLRALRRAVVVEAAAAGREGLLARARKLYRQRAKLVRGPSWMSLHKRLTEVKRQPDRTWLRDVSSYVVREACRDVDNAYKHFFRRLKEGKRGKAAGEPRFRLRNERSGRGFHVAQPQAVNATERTVRIPGVGEVKLKEHGYIPVAANYRALACREVAGRWYVSVVVEEQAPPRKVPAAKTVGVEVGVRALAVTSEGREFKAIRALEQLPTLKRRLALWSRRMARRYKRGVATKLQSAGWREATVEVAKYNAQIAALRRDVLHQTSIRIVRASKAQTLVLRDMQVQKMIGRAGKKSRQEKRARNAIAPMVSEVGMYELRRQLAYKQSDVGGEIVVAPNDYPSSRRCSRCGAVRETEPGYPDFRCQSPTCGAGIDREANSAYNLRDFAGGNPSGTGGGARRRKTAKAAQRPDEPGSSDDGSDVDVLGPDGDETSALGTGNRATAEQSAVGTDAE